MTCCTIFFMKTHIVSNVKSRLTLLLMKREDYFSTWMYLMSISSAWTPKSFTIKNRLQFRPTEPLPKLKPKGCSLNISNDRALSDQFANLTDIEQIKTRLDQVLNQCARVAKYKGYKYFAIHNYGECYGGGGNYTIHRRKSVHCLNFANKLRYGVGKENSSFVYKILA